MTKSIIILFLTFLFSMNTRAEVCDVDLFLVEYGLTKKQLKEMGKIIKKNYIDSKGNKVKGKLRKEGICELVYGNEIKIKDRKPTVKTESIKNVIFEKVSEKRIYIKLSNFGNSTEDELKSILSSNIWDKISEVILDLRGNEGGALFNVLKVIRLLGDKGQVIGHIKGSYEFTYKVENSDGFSLKGKRVVVLTDGNTSKGAELFVSFLSESGMASIAGEKTKGDSVVEIAPRINDEKYMIIPSGYLYSPSKGIIHKLGINPEYVIDFNGCNDKHQLCVDQLSLIFE